MPRRHQKPENTKHREGDFMYYTYYHEFKTKDGEIVYHKNCCKKRIKGRNNDREDTPRMIKKKKERLILELKKKLLTAVNSFSLFDLEAIIEIAERDPVFIVKTIATHGDCSNNGGSGSGSGFGSGTDYGDNCQNTIKSHAYSDDGISTGDSTGDSTDNGSTYNESIDNGNIRSRL